MLQPLSENDWDRDKAAHLLNRAGFGGTPKEIDALLKLGPFKAVSSFLEASEDTELFPVPTLLDPAARIEWRKREKAAANDQGRNAVRRRLNEADRLSMFGLRVWWLNRMRYTDAPLREKATLFWHGHFATSNQKVRDSYLMWVQNETLRRFALGKFPDLLKAMSRDPAMIRWLDLNQSRRGHPNENFAREIMELFSLGEGHYSEEDIQEAARAFTGYRIEPDTGAFRFMPRDFDDGPKTFFGQTGPFTGDQIIDMIIARPECARFLGRKIWKFFVSDDPSEETVTAVAATLLSNGYDLGKTLRVIFLSEEFYAPKVIRHQIKGPVQWLIQTTRMLEIPLPDARVVENSLASLGQVLFAPPNVKGWDGGRSWISASTLLYRYNLAAYLLSGKASVLGGGGTVVASVPLGRIAPGDLRTSPDRLLPPLIFRVFNGPAPEKEKGAFGSFLGVRSIPYDDDTVRDLMQMMMSTPEYQLT